MKRLLALCILLTGATTSAWGATQVMVQDFEKNDSLPSVWVVNIPNENASVKLSADGPHDGKQCLKLHYHFVGTGQFQYLGIPNKVRIQTPIHKLRFWLKGDNSLCSYGVQLSDASGETHQFSKNTGQGGLIDFTGWKEVVIDLDSHHETWGGDKNGKIDYPITAIVFTVGQPTNPATKDKPLAAQGDLYFDSLSVDSEKTAEETLGGVVSVVSPDYCSDVKGDVAIKLAAPGFKSVTAKCWKQGEGFGADSTVATVSLDAEGHGLVRLSRRSISAWPDHGANRRRKRRRQRQLLLAALQPRRRFLERRHAQRPAAGRARHVAGVRRRLQRTAFDLQHRFEGDVLRPQAAGRLARFQRAYVFGSRFAEKPVHASRFLFADQGQRQAQELRHDFLDEERRHRRHRQRAVLFRMPVHRPQRHRHLARLLADDRLHERTRSKAARRRATNWTSSKPTAAKARTSRTPSTPT